jgi:hypothetical protein
MFVWRVLSEEQIENTEKDLDVQKHRGIKISTMNHTVSLGLGKKTS